MTIRIASAPVSWGIFEFEGIEPIFQYPQVMDEIASTGHTGIELGPYGYLPTDPAKLQAELDKRHLQLLSAFVPVNLVDASAHEKGAQEALKVGRLLAACGASYIVLADDNGKVPELVKNAGRRSGSKLTPAQWDVFAEGTNKIARRLHDELGLKIVFHHHCAGYVETPDEVRALLQRTDRDLVGLCLDTGHWHYGAGKSSTEGGSTAVDCIKEFGERVRYLHFKDCSTAVSKQCRSEGKDYFEAVKAGVFCPLGQGEVDFPGVVREMEKLGYDGWAIVEQDVFITDPSVPKRISQVNRDYLKSIGL